MLAFPASVQIYLAVQPVDMRKSFNGLWAAVSEQLGEEPKSGAVFAFINKLVGAALNRFINRTCRTVPKTIRHAATIFVYIRYRSYTRKPLSEPL
jgi:hypothetical protein